MQNLDKPVRDTNPNSTKKIDSIIKKVCVQNLHVIDCRIENDLTFCLMAFALHCKISSSRKIYFESRSGTGKLQETFISKWKVAAILQ